MERLEGALQMQKNASDVINLRIMVHIKARLISKGDKATLAELSRVSRMEKLLDILGKMLHLEDSLLDWYKALSSGVPGDVNNQLSKSVGYIEKSSRSMAKVWAPVVKPQTKELQLQDIIVPMEAASQLQGAAPGSSKLAAPPRSPTKDKADIGDIIEGLISTKTTINRSRAMSKIQKLLEPPHQKQHIAITQSERDRQAQQAKALLRNMKSYDPFERKIAHLDRDMHRCLTALQQVVEVIHQNEAMISGSKQLSLDKHDVQRLLLIFPQPYVLEEDLSD